MDSPTIEWKHQLTQQEMNEWKSYEVIYLTPDSCTWMPHATHCFTKAKRLIIDTEIDYSVGMILAAEKNSKV